MKFSISLIVLSMLVFSSCSQGQSHQQTWEKPTQQELEGLSKAYFASGCFWCVEAIYEHVEGVKEVISGYAGGHKNQPTYREVGGGKTGHAETVEVYYDPDVVSFETLVKVYYGSQDPTTENGQHPDYGSAYRSIIFYANEQEREIAERLKGELDASGQYDAPVVTEIKEIDTFWPAEDYHQDFERLNPNQGYIRAVSIPRLNRFKAKFPELIKKDH